MLAAAERDRRNALLCQRIRVEPAVHAHRDGLQPLFLRGEAGEADGRMAVGQPEGRVVGLGPELNPAPFTADVAHRAGRRFESAAVGRRDDRQKFGIVAAAFAPDEDVVRDLVRCLAAADDAHIGRSGPLPLADQAEEALRCNGLDRARGGQHRGYTVLRMHPCVARPPAHVRLPARRADGARDDLVRIARVEIERHRWLAEVGGPDRLGAVEADLLRDREEEGQRRVRPFLAQHDLGRGDDRRDGGAVVRPDGRGALGYDAVAAAYRHGAAAQRYRVHVAEEHPARRAEGAGDLHDQVADGEGALEPAVGVVVADPRRLAPRVDQPAADLVAHRSLLPAHRLDPEERHQVVERAAVENLVASAHENVSMDARRMTRRTT